MADTTDPKTIKETAQAARSATDAINEMSKAMNDQLSIALQLNDAYKSFAENKLVDEFKDFTKSFSDLTEQIEDLIKNLKDSKKNFTDFTDQTKSTDKTVDSLSNQIKKLSTNMLDVPTKQSTGLFKGLSSILKGPLSGALGAATGAAVGLFSGFEGILSTGKMLGGFFVNAASWAMQLGMAIIAIPVRFLGGLVEMAANMNLQMTDYLRNIEAVREKFGNFRVGQSLAIKEMQRGFAKTTETGLSAFQIYGTLADRLKAITELVEGMGAQFGKFSSEMSTGGYTQAKRIDEFRMGLGLSNEQLKTMMMLTSAEGKSASSQLTGMTKHVKAYASALGISHKDISKDIADAVKDAGKFGGATVDAIARASAYARSLGHDLKEVAGVLDAFETFDTAAEGAAKLAQSFGATVDAFKLVSAQSPDEMIQHLRDSMFAAGKTADVMTRQELKLLASQSGLSEEVARSVFSMKNQGKSVEELMKIQEKQEDAQVTQAKALKSLAEDIRRLVFEMQPLRKSFVDMFVDGMKKGITYSKDFVGLMMEIRKGLMLVWREGFKLGRVLLSEVPALKQLTAGLRAFFEPSKFKQLAEKMRFILLDFFKGKEGVSNILHRVQEAFTNFFNLENPAAKQMLTGAKMIFTQVSKVFAEGIKWVGEQFATGLKFFADVISGKQKLGEAGSMAKGGLGFVQDLIAPIIKSIVEVAPVVGDAILQLLTAVGHKAIDIIQNNKTVRTMLEKVGWTLVSLIAGGMVIRAAIGAMTASLTNAAIGAVGNVLSGKGGLSKQIESAAGKAASASNKVGKALPTEKGNVGQQTGSLLEGWVAAAKAAGKVSLKDIGKLFLILSATGAGLAVAGVAFAFGLKQMYEQLKGIKLEELVPVFVSLGVLLGSMSALAVEMALIGKIADPKSIGMGALVLGVAGLFLGAMLGLVGLIAKGMQSMGLTPAIMNATGNLLNSIATTMLLMVPLLGASALIGAFLMGPQGIVVAAAAGLGFAAISAGIAGLAAIATSVVKTLNDIKLNEGIEKKAQAFTSILSSINEMTKVIATILHELSPSLSDVLNVFMGGKVTDRIERMTEFLNSLLPNIKGIIVIAKDSIVALANGGDTMLKSANIFASILSSVGVFLKAIVPSKDLLSSSTEEYGIFSTKITKTSGSAINYVKTVSNSVTGFLKTISSFIEQITTSVTTSDIYEKKIPAIATMMTSIGTLMSAIIPSQETIQMFKKIESREEDMGLFSTTTKKTLEKMDTKSLSQFLSFTAQNFNVLLKTLMSGEFTNFLTDASNIIKTPQQLKSIELVGSIMSSIGNIIKSISDASKLPEVKNITAGDKSKINVSFNTTDVNAVLTNLAGNSGGIAKMFDMVMILTSSLKGTKDITPQLSVLNKMFESIGQVSTFIKTLSDSMQQSKEGTNLTTSDVDKMMAPLVTLEMVLERMGEQKAGSGSLSAISAQLLALAGNKETLGNLDAAAEIGKQVASSVKAVKTNVIENGLLPALDAVKQMNDSLNKMNDAMSNIQLGKKTVQTGLQTVANAMGVGGKANYTINNKPINIHLEIQVEMKAAELERTIIFRKESVIRDQLRWIRGSEQGHGAFENNELSKNPKEEYTPHVTG